MQNLEMTPNILVDDQKKKNHENISLTFHSYNVTSKCLGNFQNTIIQKYTHCSCLSISICFLYIL